VSTYEEDASTTGPIWLRTGNARAWRESIGALCDWTLDVLKQAVQARFVSLAPVDALPWIGWERRLPRYPGDTDATYRTRLAAAWDRWQYAGTETGILAGLEDIGFTEAAIYTALGPNPPGEVTWPPDGDTANWSRFWILIDATTATGANPFAWEAVLWGDRDWGTFLWGGITATAGEVELLRGVVDTWKAAHELCAGFLIDLDGGYRVRIAGR